LYSKNLAPRAAQTSSVLERQPQNLFNALSEAPVWLAIDASNPFLICKRRSMPKTGKANAPTVFQAMNTEIRIFEFKGKIRTNLKNEFKDSG
jgi:hypothetical protein